jgi:hypothetical protein
MALSGDGYSRMDCPGSFASPRGQGVCTGEETMDCRAHLWLVAMVSASGAGL